MNQAVRPLIDPPSVSGAAMQCLLAYHWPGNVCELENSVQRSLVVSGGNVSDIEHLPSYLRAFEKVEPLPKFEILPLGELERRAILHALQETSNDKKMAAKALGIGKAHR